MFKEKPSLIYVLRHLSLMAEECSDEMLLKWFRVIECLGAGGISPVEDIIQAIPVFTMYPYHFSTLPRQHIVSFFQQLFFNDTHPPIITLLNIIYIL